MNYKINVINKWITIDMIIKPDLFYLLKYYWIGLINNEKHKFSYIQIRSEIEILKEKSVAMHEDLFNFYQSKERKDGKIKNHCLDDDIIKIFLEIDNILIKNYKIMYCTRAPTNQFIKSYFLIRDETCLLKEKNSTIDKRLNSMTSIIMKLEVISEFIKSSVDKNDQMLFKLLLLILNLFTLIGQYFWNNFKNY